jgi:hypothetical protein
MEKRRKWKIIYKIKTSNESLQTNGSTERPIGRAKMGCRDVL